MLVDRQNTPLTTDYQSVQLILATAHRPRTFSARKLQLVVRQIQQMRRINFVYARIGYNKR